MSASRSDTLVTPSRRLPSSDSSYQTWNVNLRATQNGIGFVVLLLVSFLALNGCVERERINLGPGDLPPDFALEDTDGIRHALSEYRGKLVILNFWAKWCVPCVEEMPALEKLYSDLKTSGVIVLAVGLDDPRASLKEFQKKLGLTYPVLVDEVGKTRKLYGLTGVPETFIIGRDGRLLLVSDPDDNKATVRIVGPRSWGEEHVIKRFKEIAK